MAAVREPDATDVHVGARMRMKRISIGMSQQDFGVLIGVTFQQVQKYEKGVNKVSASRLQRVCEALGVTVAFLYDGLDGQKRSTADILPQYLVQFMGTGAGQRLVEAYGSITDDAVRTALCKLAVSIAEMRPRRRKKKD